MIIQGLMEVLQPMTILLVAIGTVVGIIFGAIPGLTATMAIVMFLPVTYSMAASEGISMLMALYIGGISGGLISAILLNIPGTPSSVASCFDGKPMATRARRARPWAPAWCSPSSALSLVSACWWSCLQCCAALL